MLGEIIGAGASLLGGLFGKKSADKANEENIKLQREFAQQGIQWKVADAKKAGIHPLAALGAQTVSFSPSVVGDNALGTGIAQAGQDIGRAINSTSTVEAKTAQLSLQMAEEQLKGLRLDNAGKGIQNAALASRAVRASQVGAPFPSLSGATNTGVPGQATSQLKLGGVLLPPNPEHSTANDLSQVYGEPGDWLGGVANMVSSERKMSNNERWALINGLLGPPGAVSLVPGGLADRLYKAYKSPRDTSRTDSADYPF